MKGKPIKLHYKSGEVEYFIDLREAMLKAWEVDSRTISHIDTPAGKLSIGKVFNEVQ